MTTPEDKLNAARENLPWLVNDTLPEDQQKEVQAMLNESDQLREDEAFWRAMRREVRNMALPAAPRELGWRRLKRDIRRDTRQQQRTRWRRLAIAASVLIVAQAALVTLPTLREEGGYHMASSGRGDTTGTTLLVQFQDRATAAEIQSLLNEYGLVIIDGPSAAGLYTVTGKAISPDLPGKLQSRVSVVRHVQAE